MSLGTFPRDENRLSVRLDIITLAIAFNYSEMLHFNVHFLRHDSHRNCLILIHHLNFVTFSHAMILFRDHHIIYISYNHSYNFGTGLIIPRCQSDIESLDKLLSYYTEGQLIHLSTTNKANKRQIKQTNVQLCISYARREV